MKRRKQKFYVWAAALLLMAHAVTLPTLALDDDEFNGCAADTLTVKVGYFGGPYYEKAVFTLDELWNMDVVYADYTFIDNMPSVVIDHVAGVRLADLMDEAGIDLNSIQTFYFWTRDKQSDYFTSYSKAELIDTARYCYYSLPDNYDDEEGKGNEFATSYGIPVDTVIALADDWNRTIAGATFGSDYLDLNTNTRFRLIFGQTDTVTRTADRSAKWIHEIVVELDGAPMLTLDASVLQGEVGSVLRTEAWVSADSAVLENEPMIWSSSDERIATVDEDGNITIHAEGTAVITVAFAGVSASVTINGTPGVKSGDNQETEGPETGEAGETGAPDGTGDLPQAEDMRPHAVMPSETEEAETGDLPQAEDARPNAVMPSETEETETARQLLTPVTVALSDVGGVQNWREEEMSETATALPNIEPDGSAAQALGVAAAALFLISGGVYAAVFYQNIGRRQNEH